MKKESNIRVDVESYRRGFEEGYTQGSKEYLSLLKKVVSNQTAVPPRIIMTDLPIKKLKKVVEIELSDKNEGTAYPFWIIIDPKQNFNVDSYGINNIAFMITGVWFSRESAQEYLDKNQHHFSKNAKVYCHSGYYSKDWRKLWGDKQ